MHDDVLERPAFRKLVEAGEIEVLDEGSPAAVAEDRIAARIKRSAGGGGANRGGTARQGDR